MTRSSARGSSWDAIVVGLGGFGSATLYQLARRGVRVLGLEQHAMGHALGSSHGESRVIRKAYFEHPDYVPLLHRAFDLWEELSAEAGQPLLQRTGLLLAGPANDEAVRGCRLAAGEHGLAIENLTPAEASREFPDFRVPEQFDVVFEREAGFLHVERCVEAYLAAARRQGADVRDHEAVHSWEATETGVRVVTSRGTYEAAKLILTAGAWMPALMQGVNVPLSVCRKVMLWYDGAATKLRVEEGAPVWFFEMPFGCFYGVPGFGGSAVKVCEHTGGLSVANPSELDRRLLTEDVDPVRQFTSQVMPGLPAEPGRHAVCMYTNSPDGHFVIDRHPGAEAVWIAAGFSGHGFKFVSVLGEALADLALEGATSLPIQFLGLDRFDADSR